MFFYTQWMYLMGLAQRVMMNPFSLHETKKGGSSGSTER